MSVKPSIIADPNAALKQARQLLASDPKAAVRQARELLESYPAEPAVMRVVGAGLRRLGKIEEAEKAEQEAIEASTRSPGHREAAKAVAAGDKRRAIAILEALVARDENDVVALVMLGLQMSLEGEFDLADALLRKAVEAAPADVSARMAMTEHLHRSKRHSDALKTLDGLGETGRTTAALSLRANILRDPGRQQEEVKILEKLAASGPRPENFRIRLGHAYRNLNRLDDSVAAYRSVIAAAPYEGTSWWSLANLKTTRFSDADIAMMERGLAIADSPLLNRIRLSFALGRAFEQRRDPQRAFRHYEEGNRLRHSIATYKPEKTREWVDQIEESFSSEFFAEREGQGFPSADPIFIVGMQRSGSTLLEQILDSHPQIEGTAELTEFPAIIREQSDIAHRRRISTVEHISKLRPKDLRAIGEEYVNRARTYRLTDKPRFTDKMPVNWIYAGIIPLVLPNARIVDVRRHPLDCCFSNWKQLYGSGLEHSYSMDNMGRYYADYVRLMRLVDEFLPGKVHRVIYERLVDDVEGEVRRLLDYLGLPFDEACLEFHSNERSVRTISAAQVRRPINREGIGQWQAYDQWLGPLRAALGPTLEDWDK